MKWLLMGQFPRVEVGVGGLLLVNGHWPGTTGLCCPSPFPLPQWWNDSSLSPSPLRESETLTIFSLRGLDRTAVRAGLGTLPAGQMPPYYQGRQAGHPITYPLR